MPVARPAAAAAAARALASLDDSDGEIVEEDLQDEPLGAATPDTEPVAASLCGDFFTGHPGQGPSLAEPGVPQPSSCLDARNAAESARKRRKLAEVAALRAKHVAATAVELDKAFRQIVAITPSAAVRSHDSSFSAAPSFAADAHPTHSLFIIGDFVACVACGSVASKRPRRITQQCCRKLAPGGDVAVRALLKGKLPSSWAEWPDGLSIGVRRPCRWVPPPPSDVQS